MDEVTVLLNDTYSSLLEDPCYKNCLNGIDVADIYLQKLYAAIVPYFEKLEKSSNSDDYLATFYGCIVRNSDQYSCKPRSPFLTLLLKKLGDRILFHYRKSSCPTNNETASNPITEEDMGSVQNLAGCVVRSFVRKSPRHSTVHAILEIMKTEDYEDQKLIAVQSRGGLTALTSDAQNLFVKAEEKFRERTDAKDIRRIDTKLMVTELMKNTDVISVYNSIT